MAYSQLYKKYFSDEIPIAKSKIVPRNFYKIVSYEYVDGTVKSFFGPKSTIVFVLGISPDKKLLCVKATEIKPEKFFLWIKKIFRKNIKDEDVQESINESTINKLILADNKLGSKIISSLKTDSIYKLAPNAYRTYLISGIKQISLLKIEEKQLRKILKLKEETEENN
jgi:hypothetical protein